jgi:ubiquinone/menaquinone biosynthesis C-methylase UbiE
MDKFNKYLKYKKKYINLKLNNQIGSGKKLKLKLKYIKGISKKRLLYNKKASKLNILFGSRMIKPINPYLESKYLLKFVERFNILPLFEKIDISNHSNFLDLGCGQGHNSLVMSRHYDNVYGLDPSEAMVQSANQLKSDVIKTTSIGQNVVFQQGDFSNIPFDEKFFDAIYLSNSIHFSEDVSTDLDNILKYLKISGYLVIKEPGTDPKFGSQQLNQPGESRNKKLAELEEARSNVIDYFSEKDGIEIIDQQENEYVFSIILKKIDK